MWFVDEDDGAVEVTDLVEDPQGVNGIPVKSSRPSLVPRPTVTIWAAMPRRFSSRTCPTV